MKSADKLGVCVAHTQSITCVRISIRAGEMPQILKHHAFAEETNLVPNTQGGWEGENAA